MPETDNDPSASTASFRAFAQRSDDDVASRKRAPNRGMIIAVVVGVLIVIGILVLTV
jgi:hypothetical protein